MPFELYTTPVAQRNLKKLPDDVRQHFITELQILRTNPFAGQQLKGKFRHLRSLHTRFHTTDYRIAYRVKQDEQSVAIWFAASRENFYRQLEKLL